MQLILHQGFSYILRSLPLLVPLETKHEYLQLKFLIIGYKLSSLNDILKYLKKLNVSYTLF